MSDMMETLKGILGDDSGEKIKDAMSSLSLGAPSNIAKDNDLSLEYLSQLKDIVGRLGNSNSDPRTNLLLSLRPYMRNRRQGSIDSAIKLLNLAKLAYLFK